MIGAHALTIRAGISYRQLDWWTKTGLIRATDDRPGSGIPRRYSEPQARLAVTMAALVREGVDPRAARRLAGKLARRGVAELGPFVISVKEAS